MTKEKTLENLKKSYKYQRNNKDKFAEWRQTFNMSKLEAIAETDNTTVEQVKKRMKREEKSRDMGFQSRHITGKGIKEPVLNTIVKNTDSSETELCSQTLMAPAIAASNREHQRKSMQTDFMVQPLLGEFGYTAAKRNALQVAEGIYIPPEGTSKYARDFLAVCKIPESIRQRQEI